MITSDKLVVVDEADICLDTKEVARILKISPATLEKARSQGTGDYPNYLKFGGRTVRYRRKDVMSWLEAHLTANDGSAVLEAKNVEQPRQTLAVQALGLPLRKEY
jgi:predicted DNA-binding transcriptional regulator AlpA